MYDASRVGRVGGLAVALGVGTAILTGYGVASAAPDSDAGPTSTAESTAGPSTTEAGEKSTTDAVDGSIPDAASDTGAHGTEDTTASTDSDSSFTPQRGRVVATGGANTRVTSGVTAEATTQRPKKLKPEESKPAEESTATTMAGVADGAKDVRGPLLAAAARRDNATTTTDFADITVKDGVITGDVPDAPPSYYTVTGAPVNGGKVTFEGAGNPGGTNGDFSFLPDASQLTARGYDRFHLLVSEKSPLVQLLEATPLKPFVKPLVVGLHQVPIIGTLLSPIIGSARAYTITVPVADFVGGDPIAFTTKITSFDGTQISVNYFPKDDLATGSDAPTILNGPSLATAGYTDPTQATTVFGLVPGLSILRGNYNVVTWDPRGEFASGGRLSLDSENFEARDVKAIIDWVATQSTTKLEGAGDPLLGMVGGSYGGGIQLTSAGIDPRIDAISPGIAWNDLTSTLYPNDAFKTSWASLLLLSLVVSGSRLESEIYSGILTGAVFGALTGKQQEFFSRNSPDTVAANIDIPTLFLQGTVDTLFPLQQAMDNALQIEPNGAPMKMIWYCGGHGQCLDPVDLNQQTDYTVGEIMNWMDTYVMNKGNADALPPDGPRFSWVDQDGNWYGSDDLPIDSDFYGTRYTVPGSTGGLLPIVPVLGGSGPQWQASFPVSLVSGAKVGLGALNLHVPSPSQDPDADPTYVVGAPRVTLTYSGLGTSRNVYAQLVDDGTGRVLGNIVSPIPVMLDGREHTTAPIDMEAIAYTMNPGDSLTLQIVDSATAFEDFTSFGVVNVTSVGLSLPTAANVTEIDMAEAAATPR
jgi:ABC-2 type transport system ATP-binding protein